MENNRDLLVIRNEGDGTRLTFSCESDKDMFDVCTALVSAIYKHPEFSIFFRKVYELLEDAEFRSALDAATLDFPDFNSILKNLD